MDYDFTLLHAYAIMYRSVAIFCFKGVICLEKRIIRLFIGTIVLLMSGLMYAWSVLSIPIKLDLPSINQGQISLVFSFAMASFCLGGLANGLLKILGRGKISIFLATILMPLGYIISSFTTDITHITVGYGILVGFSVGIVYAYILSNITYLFPGKQGIISGILLFGFGMSSLVFGPIYTKLVSGSPDLWRTLFRYYGIIMLAVLFLSAILIPDQNPKKDNIEDNTSTRPSSMVGTSAFWIIFLFCLIVSGTGLAIISQGANIVSTSIRNISPEKIALYIGIISISNGFGRILVGHLFDTLGYLFSMRFITITALSSQLLLILNMSIGSNTLLLIAFILLGISYGGAPSFNSAIAIKLFGQRYYSINLSLLNLQLLIASTFSTISGNLFDKYNSYLPTFYLSIGAVLIAFILIYFMQKSVETMEKSEEKNIRHEQAQKA